MTVIVPAIIAKTQRELDSMLAKVRGKVKRVQLDIMDGEFVPNTSLNFDIQLPTDLKYEAHLMVTHPLEWVKEHADLVDIITLHVEAVESIGTAVDVVKKRAAKVYLALVPDTTIETVIPPS